MATLKLTGIAPYDGEYELPTSFTNGELHRVKQICGVTAGQLGEAFSEGDVGAMVAITAVILERNGHTPVNLQLLWDATADSFGVHLDEEPEDSDRPPATATSGGNENESAAVANKNAQTASSGESGMDTGANSQPTPLLTGDLGSVERAVSA